MMQEFEVNVMAVIDHYELICVDDINSLFRQHVQTKSNNIKTSLPDDTVKVLEEMEDLTMKLLLEIVAGYTEVAVELIDIMYIV